LVSHIKERTYVENILGKNAEKNAGIKEKGDNWRLKECA
jgi:hypothetical protein